MTLEEAFEAMKNQNPVTYVGRHLCYEKDPLHIADLLLRNGEFYASIYHDDGRVVKAACDIANIKAWVDPQQRLRDRFDYAMTRVVGAPCVTFDAENNRVEMSLEQFEKIVGCYRGDER